MRWLLLGVALVSCTGEQVETRSSDAATSDTSSSCAPVEGNLVQNPSFEISVDGTLSGWKSPDRGTITQQKGNAGHCEAWAEVTLPPASSSFPVFFGQDVIADPPLSAGATIKVSFMARTLDADLTGEIQIGVVSGGYSPKAITLNADMTWKRYEHEWTLTTESAGAVGLFVAFVSQSDKARKVGIDQVTFTVSR